MKYKINNNDINNTPSRDMVDQDKHKKIKTGSNSIYTIDIKKIRRKESYYFRYIY